MSKGITRRHALGGLGGGLLLPWGAAPARSDDVGAAGPFRHGVASGDPDHDSLVIWTRVSGAAGPVHVAWELAGDRDFAGILGRGTVTTGPQRDHTVKVLVTGLPAGGVFYYRFSVNGVYSEIGRTRSLPRGPEAYLGIAVASCSNFPFGYFNAYEAIAGDDRVQWVLHLGDYIYEYGPDGYGGASGRQLQREHEPQRELVALADYRVRHAQYKADPQSRAMHAAHPLLPVWDDHESANNPWTGGAENHQPDEEGDWLARRSASLQAWFEWMPVREPLPGHSRRDYWRHWRFGSLASLITLETRHSGRAQQLEYGDHAARLTDRDSAQRFLREEVGAADRPMLAPAMEAFLSAALTETVAAGRPWRLIGNQIPMARTHHPRLPEESVATLTARLPEPAAARLRRLARMGELDLPLYLDPWDGYPRAREAFYRRCAQAGVRDLLVLTGDSHSFWLNRLHDNAGGAMGVELGTTGITSPGDFIDLGEEGARLMDTQLAAGNAEVLWTEGRTHGYVCLQLTPAEAIADFVGVSTIASRDFRALPLRRARLRRSGEGLVLQGDAGVS